MAERYYKAGQMDAFRMNEKLSSDFFIDSECWDAYSMGFDQAREAINGRIH